MKEKYIFIIAAILYVLLVYTTWDTAITKSPDGRIIITFWHTYNDHEERILRRIISKWEKTNKDYTIRPVRIPFDGHKPKIRTALTVGQGPDMARVDWSFVSELALKKGVVNLDGIGFEEISGRYVQAPLRTGFIDGKHYSIPDQTTCVALFYNKEMFAKAGLPDSAPTTWEEFIEYGKKLTTDGGQYGFAMYNTLWWHLPIINTFGAPIMDETGSKSLVTSPETIEAINFIASLYKEHKIEASAWATGRTDPESGFLNRRYAMIFMGSWNLARFRETDLDFGVGLIPAGPEGSSTNVGGTNVVIFKCSEHQQASYDFLTFFTNAENQALWCSQLNQLPINTGAYDLVEFEDKDLQVFMEQMRHARANPIISNYDMLEDIFNPEMETVLRGLKSAETAMQDVKRRLRREVLDN